MTQRRIWLALVLLGAVLVAVANAHLVYVAMSSQPECVEHRMSGGSDGRYRAAKPAC